MRDGFKIVDTDSHMMEPEWLWERYMEDAYKSQAPKIGKAPESGRRAFLVEGDSFVREKGKYPMAAPAFFDAVKLITERLPLLHNLIVEVALLGLLVYAVVKLFEKHP